MPEYYATEEVTKDKFLFISYCHEDKPVVDACAKVLIDEGVRLWYDKALTATNEWPTIVEDMLRHENCCGAFLFCSGASLASKNVAKERKIALEERKKRGKRDYPVFFVVVTKDRPVSYVQLIKQALDSVSPERIDDVFPLENLSVFMELIGNDSIYRMTHMEGYEQVLLGDVRQLVPQAVNKNVIYREAMEAHAGANRVITAEIGRWTVNGEEKPITWYFIKEEEGIATLVSAEILSEGLGGEDLDNWLNGEFVQKGFTEQERSLLQGKLRLLTEEQARDVDQKILAVGQQWWLGSARGNLQMIVREDGTVYRNGYNNKRFEKGIRPAISMSMVDISNLVLNQ